MRFAIAECENTLGNFIDGRTEVGELSSPQANDSLILGLLQLWQGLEHFFLRAEDLELSGD